MKIWNVGLSETNGTNHGYQVAAENADVALSKARERASASLTLQGGGMTQRRDPNGGNEYFDRNYPLRHAPDELLV